MLETNNPYMFGSSTTTTTTTTTTSTATGNPSSQPPPPAPSSSPSPSSSSASASASALASSTGNTNHINNNMQQPRPMHHNNTYYIGKDEKDDYYHNHPHASRMSPTFIRHPEEQQPSVNYTSTYKTNKSINQNTHNIVHQHNDPERVNNFMRSQVHVYPQHQRIKREASPNVLPATPSPPTFMKSKKMVKEPDWYQGENKSHKLTANTNTNTNTIAATTTTIPTAAEVSTLEAGDNKKIKRRKEMTGIMEDLNKDFLKKKEKLYVEKMNAINQELKDAHQDDHPSYLEGLRDLEMTRKKTIDDGILFQNYQRKVTDNQFQLEIYQAEQEYTAEIQDIREKLFAGLDEKRRKLKEEKDNCDLAYDVILESQARLQKRNLRKREKEHPENKSGKKKQLTGPALVFKLKDEDILSDMQAMRNGSSSTSTGESAPSKKTNSSSKKKSL